MERKAALQDLFDKYFEELETRGVSMPKFEKAKEVIIFSDYSGERKEDNYFSYSFYVVEIGTIQNAIDEILELRKKESEWKDNSFIEYKKLKKDKVRQRILPQFLKVFDQYEGLIITILIDKSGSDFFMKVTDKDVKQIEDLGLGKWKIQILRKISNILTILVLITKRVINENIALTWYSDRDDIFGANQSKRAKTLDILSQFLHVFEAKIKDKNFRYVSDKHSLINSDFLAISDLSAGAVLDYYQLPQDRSLKDWTKQIIGWMSQNNKKLKKLMIVGQKKGGLIKFYDINKIE